MDHPKSRREFCTQALSLVTAGSLLESCGGGGNPNTPGGGSNVPALSTINAPASGGIVTIANVDGSALANVGNAAFVRAPAGPGVFLVVRTGQGTFNAMTAICTHEACEITRFQSGTFVCPCHGSQYGSSGAVQSGPATRSLQQFATQFTNNVLTITV